jgi:hypothetical protein
MTDTHKIIAEGIAKELGAICMPMLTPQGYEDQSWYQFAWPTKNLTIILCDGKIWLNNTNDIRTKGGIPLSDPNLISRWLSRCFRCGGRFLLWASCLESNNRPQNTPSPPQPHPNPKNQTPTKTANRAHPHTKYKISHNMPQRYRYQTSETHHATTTQNTRRHSPRPSQRTRSQKLPQRPQPRQRLVPLEMVQIRIPHKIQTTRTHSHHQRNNLHLPNNNPHKPAGIPLSHPNLLKLIQKELHTSPGCQKSEAPHTRKNSKIQKRGPTPNY